MNETRHACSCGFNDGWDTVLQQKFSDEQLIRELTDIIVSADLRDPSRKIPKFENIAWSDSSSSAMAGVITHHGEIIESWKWVFNDKSSMGHINNLEVAAGILSTQRADTDCWITDNSSALRAFVKGFSGSEHIDNLLRLWFTMKTPSAAAWVPTIFQLADPLTRSAPIKVEFLSKCVNFRIQKWYVPRWIMPKKGEIGGSLVIACARAASRISA
jgi:hypothetical protein